MGNVHQFPSGPVPNVSNGVPILGQTVMVDRDEIAFAESIIRAALSHVTATDQANAAANLADPRPRPLTSALFDVARLVETWRDPEARERMNAERAEWEAQQAAHTDTESTP